MITTHAVLVGAQPIPNLIPAMFRRPEKIHLLISDKMALQAARLCRYFRSQGTVCTTHRIDPYNMGQVYEPVKQETYTKMLTIALNFMGIEKAELLAFPRMEWGYVLHPYLKICQSSPALLSGRDHAALECQDQPPDAFKVVALPLPSSHWYRPAGIWGLIPKSTWRMSSAASCPIPQSRSINSSLITGNQPDWHNVTQLSHTE